MPLLSLPAKATEISLVCPNWIAATKANACDDKEFMGF